MCMLVGEPGLSCKVGVGDASRVWESHLRYTQVHIALSSGRSHGGMR